MNLPPPLFEIAAGLRDAIAPARCMGCLQEHTWLCRQCAQSLRPFEQQCIVCEEDRPNGRTCADCATNTPLTGVVSAGAYGNSMLRRGIHWLKFKGIRKPSTPLARLLVPYLAIIAPPDQLRQHAALVPIPLHARKFAHRGFNQSEDIAREISHAAGIPLLPLLVRTKPTWTQTKLPHELRAQNTSDAFAITPNASIPKHITYFILIDDVTTTGSTLSSAAQALKESAPSPSQLWAATIARG